MSYLVEYMADDLQFSGPHYARSIDIMKEVSEKEYQHMKEIEHPVHLTMAN